MSSTFVGHPGPVEALFPGADGNLVNVVSFLGAGKASTPQNTIILGAPGVGKSIVLGKLLLETDPCFGFSAIIDFGLSQSPYPKSHGIEPVILRLDGSQTLNIFDTQGLPLSPFATATYTAIVARIVGVPHDDDKARHKAGMIEREIQQLFIDKAEDELRRWPQAKRETLLRHSLTLHRWMKDEKCSLLDAFIQFRELDATHPDESRIKLSALSGDELRDHESQYPAEVRALLFAYLKPEEHLRLSSLREHLEMSEEEESRWLAILLVPWTEGGAYGRLFDGAGNTASKGPVQYVELGQLPKAAKEVTDVIGFSLINQLHNGVR